LAHRETVFRLTRNMLATSAGVSRDSVSDRRRDMLRAFLLQLRTSDPEIVFRIPCPEPVTNCYGFQTWFTFNYCKSNQKVHSVRF